MAFIRTIPPSDAEGPVREMYEQAHGRFGYVPNWAKAFSLVLRAPLSLNVGLLDADGAKFENLANRISRRYWRSSTTLRRLTEETGGRHPTCRRNELASEIADGVIFWVAEEGRRLLGVMGIQDKGDVALVRHAYVTPTAWADASWARQVATSVVLADRRWMEAQRRAPGDG